VLDNPATWSLLLRFSNNYTHPSQLSALTLASLLALTAGADQAQAQSTETITVTGQRSSIRKAVLAQSRADNIVSVISADDIGSLPDINASEALARMPGISVQRDQGEGRYVTVRGLGPDLNSVTINGANLVTISGNGASRIFNIGAGNYNVTLSGLVIANGGNSGIANSSTGTVSVTNCTISGNMAPLDGGGIFNSGTIIVTYSTLTGNSTVGGLGGGIANYGTLKVINSTLSGNSASGGGGISNTGGGAVSLTNSTLSGNSASNGGGISTSGTVNVNNTIIANSTGGDVFRVSGTVNASYSLIEDGLTAVNGTNSNNRTGDPNLGPLTNNGGPTQTHALQYGSSAINAGSNALAVDASSVALTTDQRGSGFPRLQGTVDIGAVEALLFIPTVTNATTNEDTQTTSALVITANAADGGGTTNYKITNILGGTLYKNDGTTAIAAGSFITKAEGLAGLKFTPTGNMFSPGTAFSFDVQASVSAADSGLRDLIITPTITVNPVADTPSVTNSSATTGTQTTSGLVISRNAVDGKEVGFFKITNITHGTLFKNNGTTVINAGDFITFDEGNAGLKFTSTNGFSGQAAFDVAGSVDNAGTGLGPVATATINVGTANPTPAQIGITGVFNRQNALYELTANVTNTTAFDINGFRLFVDYTSYLGAFPSLKLQNASSYSPVYVDYPYPVKVGATVPVRLSFYTSNRTFPNPFSPVLNVTTLSTSQTAQPNSPGVQVDRVLALNPGPNQTILLEFPSVVGHWYRISYSSNDMSHWFYSAIPVQATGSRTQWIDTGAPLTDSPPAPPNVTSRFYKVSEIVTP